jgi:hypothetical protein
VVLGSDSLVTLVIGKHTTPASSCKIQRIANVFISASGAIGQASGFSAFDIAKRAASNNTELIVAANRFEVGARKPFAAYLSRLRKESPLEFMRFCNDRDCLQVVFATVENGVPKIAVRAFKVRVKGNSIIVTPDSRMDCPGNCATGFEQTVLGVNDEATSIFDRTPHFWRVKGIVPGMEELIGAEISAHGDVVGPPISILMLDKQGARFLPEHQGLCQDQMSNP